MLATARVTSKGQLTIPALFRKRLNCQVVELEERDGEVIIRPVRSVAGALADYAGKIDNKSYAEIRDAAWKEAMHEKRLASGR